MGGKKKIDVPLFTNKPPRGRPIKYNFTEFCKENVKYIIFPGLTIKHYDSIRSSFCRWRKIKSISGRFEYDFLDATERDQSAIVIWRSGEF